MNKEQAALILYGITLGKAITHEELIDLIKNNLTKIDGFKNLNNDDINIIAFYYEHRYGSRTFVPSSTLQANSSDETWFHKKKKCMSPDDHLFEERYKKYLIMQHYGEDTTKHIIQEAEKVLSMCADPNSNERKKGLVMGDVQSGKTSNYLALANLACDYGYKIILILAGITDSLRIQTQERTDEALVGAVSATIGNKEFISYVGVGSLDNGGYYAIPLTTNLSDFSGSNLSFTSNDLSKPQVLVVKKNKSILEAVKRWLKPGQTNISSNNILIIDDECDNASINTRKDDDNPSTINGLIRDIYNNFTCSTYVGYTATPFANIFINPEKEVGYDDLFPSDFIHRLKSSEDSTYFGMKKAMNMNHCKIINDKENYKLPAKHKKDFEIECLWDSLKDSICVFLICNVIRSLRGDVVKHRSMMINVSPYNKIQNRIFELVERYINMLKDAIPQYDRYTIDRFIKHKELNRIYQLYMKDSLFNIPNDNYNGKAINNTIDFDIIKDKLFDEISKFRVALINNKRKGDQRFHYGDYKQSGARVIAIGGYVLSRGLTLEGLMTSYYSRNSTAYDTLLQMCRWFGYRPNYEDLCSIYLSQESFDCFGAISDAIDNLDTQLDVMAARGAAPKEFGLMIKESPETLETDLLITSRNKMRNSFEKVLGLNYSGVAIDTSKLYVDPSRNNINKVAVDNLISNLTNYGLSINIYNNRYMIKDVPNSFISNFILSVDFPYENRKFDSESIADFINKGDFYSKWDIVFATGSLLNNYVPYKLNGNYSIPPVQRSFDYEVDEEIIRVSKNNNRLLEPGIFNSGLTEDKIKEAKEYAIKRIELKTGKNATNVKPIAEDYLSVKDRNPLLIILPIKLIQDESSKVGGDFSEAKQKVIDSFSGNNYLIGIGIGFAGREGKVMMKFRINKVKQNEYLKKFIQEEDEVTDD